MTYEKFCNRVLKFGEDEKADRKTARNMAIKLFVLIGELSVTLGYLIGCVMPALAIVGGLVLFVITAVTLFEYISESKETYLRWVKVSKLWWVGFILMIAAVLAMRMFLR